MDTYPQTPKNRVRRKPDRAAYDRETVFSILDEALICDVAFVVDGQPYAIPMNFGRLGETIYLHGAPASRLLKYIQGQPVCLTTTLADGIVLARSVFHHSINYRSVTLFGAGRVVTDPDEKWRALEAITEHVAPGRWQDARQPNPKEMDATLVVAVEIETAAAKMRGGPPIDDPDDLPGAVWAGVLPLRLAPQPLEPDAGGAALEAPEYLRRYRRGKR